MNNTYTSPSLEVVDLRPQAILCVSMEGLKTEDEYEW